MELKFDNGLHKANEIWRSYIVFEHVHGIIVIGKDILTPGFVLSLNEQLYLLGRVRKNLSAVVLKH